MERDHPSQTAAETSDIDADVNQLSLEQAANLLLDECRMVLPGVLALLGFQLVAVFNSGFRDVLSRGEQLLHLGAVLAGVLSIAMIMTPAAIHRTREQMSVSRSFIRLSSRLLMLGMVPLAIGITADVYLVARILTQSASAALVASAMCDVAFVSLWILVPRRARLRARTYDVTDDLH
jgi:hypothetical protein